jgi:LuxR family transcriptional regulator, glucitol operon activator
MQGTVKIFCSYANKDQSFLSTLKTHLFPLQRQGLIDTWSDIDISPGTDWEKNIETHLSTAHIILLLISPDFMASDYCYSKEMQDALERHDQGEACIIPIILRPVDWQDTPLGKIQALPLKAKPIVLWKDLDEAFFDVALGIRKVVEEILTNEKISRATIPSGSVGTKDPAPSKPRHNLPRLSIDFLGRERDVARVLAALSSRSYIISIEGLAGVGKTTLAIQAALYSLSEPNRLFDQIVWISTEERAGPEEYWLYEVLDTIARELSSPVITKVPLEQKALEVEQLLRDRSTLVIIDDYETISYPNLQAWIDKVPAPSKLLMTSRSSTWRKVEVILLEGLEDAQALRLTRNICRRWGLRSLESASDDTLIPLIKVTRGNPKAIELALGHVKAGGLSFDEVVDHLYVANEPVKNIFHELYNRSWSKMKQDARNALIVVPFFADSVSREALGATAELSHIHLQLAVEELVQFMFIDVNQEELISSQRYSTHPLTRAFALTQLNQVPEYEQEARNRWSQYYLKTITERLAKGRSGDPYWDTLVRSGEAAYIDREWLNIRKVLEWADQEGHDQVLIDIMSLLAHYMNRHFYYSERLLYARKASEAADRLQHKVEAALFRIDTLGWTLIEENRLAEAEQVITKGLHIAQTLDASTTISAELTSLAHIFLARVSLQQGNLTEAAKHIEKVILSKCRPVIQFRSWMIAGDIAYKQKDVEKAIQLYENAHDIGGQYGNEGEDEDLSYRLAIAYLAKGDFQKAELSFKNLPKIEKYASVTVGAIYAKIEEAHFARIRNEKDKARRIAQEALNNLSPAFESHWMLDEIRNLLESLETNP